MVVLSHWSWVPIIIGTSPAAFALLRLCLNSSNVVGVASPSFSSLDRLK